MADAQAVRTCPAESCEGSHLSGPVRIRHEVQRGGSRRMLSLECAMWLRHGWLRVRVGLWLCGLPLRLRMYTLPSLLYRLTLARWTRGHLLERDRAVETVVRLCQARLFRLPLFPRSCLRQALALYYMLTRMGYPIAIHFGVRKEGEELHGHSWVTFQGTPVAERTRTDLFTIVYSYPAPAGRFPHVTEACEMPRRFPWTKM